MDSVGEGLIPELVRLRLGGKSQAAIAAALGVSQSIVCRTLQRPDVRAEIDRVNADSYAAIVDQRARLALKALGVLEAQLGSEDERVAQGAANSLLDRCGVTKETAVRVAEGPSDLASAVDLAKRIAARLGLDPVDAENRDEVAG